MIISLQQDVEGFILQSHHRSKNDTQNCIRTLAYYNWYIDPRPIIKQILEYHHIAPEHSSLQRYIILQLLVHISSYFDKPNDYISLFFVDRINQWVEVACLVRKLDKLPLWYCFDDLFQL